MLSRAENELLCRVGADAPMGRMMRRYWLPAAMSSELVAGTPKRVRLLGETFVAFRDDAGAVAVLDELRVASYPVYESAGIAWTYLGPAPAPPVPDFAYARVPASHRLNAKHRTDCNWAQSLEGAIDTAHSNYLHSDDIRPEEGIARSHFTPTTTRRPSQDGRPRILTEDTAYGFRYAAIRRPLVDQEKNHYVRVTHFVAPFTAVIPLGDLQNVQIFAPIDDEHTYMYNVKFSAEPIPEERLARLLPVGPFDGDFGTNRNRANNWLQDRAAMRSSSFTGIEVVRNQDTAVQESMGPIFDRTKEHLGASDVAIIRMRRRMLDSVRAFIESGAAPLGIAEPFDYGEPVGAEGMLPIDQPWQRLLGATAPA